MVVLVLWLGDTITILADIGNGGDLVLTVTALENNNRITCG